MEGEGELASVLMQMAVVGLVFFLFLVPTQKTLIDAEGFKARAHSLDNALLADALMTLEHGTARAAYRLSDAHYQVQLQENLVTTTNWVREGATARSRYATREGVEVQERDGTSRSYQWIKSPASLRIDVLVHGSGCPEIAENPQFSDPVTGAGNVLSQRILAAGLAYLSVDVAAGDEETATLTVRLEDQERAQIRYPDDPQGRRLACLATQELSAKGVEVDSQPHNRPGALVLLPSDGDERDMESALVCAYRRLAGNACR